MQRILNAITTITSFFIAGAAQSANFSTTEVQLHFGDGYHLGRNGPNTTARTTITLEHFSTFDYGDVFFFIDNFYDYDGSSTGKGSDQYGEIYGHISGKSFGLNFSDTSFVSDIALGLGINQGTDLIIGLYGVRASFNAPGFKLLTLGIYAYDTITDPFNRDLDATYQATLSWNKPFAIGDQKFTFKGFSDFIGERGSGVDNQIVFSPQLRWDIGHAFGGHEGKINLGLEYTHFENKFGVSGMNDDSLSLFIGFKLH